MRRISLVIFYAVKSAFNMEYPASYATRSSFLPGFFRHQYAGR